MAAAAAEDWNQDDKEDDLKTNDLLDMVLHGKGDKLTDAKAYLDRISYDIDLDWLYRLRSSAHYNSYD